MWGCAPFTPFGGGFSLAGLLFWAVAILVAVWALRALLAGKNTKEHHRGARADREDAMRILRLRLAEGTLSEEEFERLRRAVES